MESDVNLIGCKWYGTPKGCGQTCPRGTILVAQNTHIGFAKTGCQSGKFSSYCCDSITAALGAIKECPATNLNNMVSGGLGSTIHNVGSVARYKDDPTLATFQECEAATVGFLFAYAAGYYILNSLAGYWQYVPLRGLVWTPISNIVYPQPKPQTCTTTVTETISVTYIRTPVSTAVCNGNQYSQACAHYSSVSASNGGLGTSSSPQNYDFKASLISQNMSP